MNTEVSTNRTTESTPLAHSGQAFAKWVEPAIAPYGHLVLPRDECGRMGGMNERLTLHTPRRPNVVWSFGDQHRHRLEQRPDALALARTPRSGVAGSVSPLSYLLPH